MNQESRTALVARRVRSAVESNVKGLDFSERAAFEAHYELCCAPIQVPRVKRNGFVLGERYSKAKSLSKHERKRIHASHAPAFLPQKEDEILRGVKRELHLGRDPFGDNDPFPSTST